MSQNPPDSYACSECGTEFRYSDQASSCERGHKYSAQRRSGATPEQASENVHGKKKK